MIRILFCILALSSIFFTDCQSLDNCEKNESKINIAICTLYTPDLTEYGKITEKINRKYAEKHGYDFIVGKINLIERSPVWDKVLMVKNCLKKKNVWGKQKYDYVFWIDADAIFNKHETKIEEFIDKSYKLVICNDIGDSILNTGTFLIENSFWSNQFLLFWWRAGELSPWAYKWPAEQLQLAWMYKGDLFGVKKSTKICHASSFNSDPSLVSHDKRNPGWKDTFIIHLMGGNHRERVKTFNALALKILGKM